MQSDRQKIATSIREFRSVNDLNQMDFSEECGISRETLGLIERCATNVTLDTLDLIAVRMGVPVSELMSFKYLYILCESNICIEDTEAPSFGIGVVAEQCLVDMMQDISTDRKEVFRVVELCNKLRLDPIHLRDVIEDFFFSI